MLKRNPSLKWHRKQEDVALKQHKGAMTKLGGKFYEGKVAAQQDSIRKEWSMKKRKKNPNVMEAGSYKGIPITVQGYGGYAATSLKLYGFRNELQLKRAIDRELKKRKKNPMKYFIEVSGRVVSKHASKDVAKMKAKEWRKYSGRGIPVQVTKRYDVSSNPSKDKRRRNTNPMRRW